jgi:hypothetical protein
MVNGQQIATGLLDAARDAIPMLGSHGIERLEDHKGQCALPDLRFSVHIGFPDEYDTSFVGKQ